MRRSREFWVSLAALILGIALMIAGSIMLGVGISKSNEKPTCQPESVTTPVTPTLPPNLDRAAIRKSIQDSITPENIKENLHTFTKTPHQAGTKANKDVANAISELWRNAGIQDVHTVSYNVLLAYPEWDNPNIVTIKDSNGGIVYNTTGVSPVYIPEEQGAPGAGIQWLAYSPNGTVTADIVYCFKGYPENFEYLENHGISLKGKIALLRYGGPFRGDKVKLAQKYGAIGAILYSDPKEAAKLGYDDADTYPNTVFMPPEGVQRGTLNTGDGDPLTPLYPSKPNLWRSTTEEEAKLNGDLPSIPTLPISYTAALQILSRLGGPEAPKSWKGGLNITYNIGGFNNGFKATIDIHGHFEIGTIQNVIGYIYGSEEPDKYVILGNHYDAWTYGAMDPNAGTAVLAEVARAVAQTANETGWRPARTIMFANWDAEEYGLIGSTEFAEEFGPILQRRAIAYINFDCFKGNQSIYVQGSPVLTDVIFDTAKSVPNPSKDEIAAGRKTVYDTWYKNYPDNTPGKDVPFLSYPLGGSDHKTLIDYLGIPSVNFYYLDTDKAFTYPLYHTLYETPFAPENLMDTDNFAVHRALGQFWIEFALRMADAPTIPFALSQLTDQLRNFYIPDLNSAILNLTKPDYTADGLNQLKNMAATANLLDQQATELDKAKFTFDSDLVSRIRWNDRMMNFENCFLNPRGTKEDPTARHVLYSISKTDSYAGKVMQQVYAVIDEMKATTDPTKLSQLSRDLANEISIVHYSLLCAGYAVNKFI